MNETLDPETHTGTPQAAVTESTGSPIAAPTMARPPVDLDQVHRGEQFRTGGLLWPMPEDFGGGWLRIRPASITEVSTARDDHERKLRDMPSVKRLHKKQDDLRGKAGVELNRFTVVMAIEEWIDAAPLLVAGTKVDVSAMGPAELRQFISDNFLPELDQGSSKPPENELNMTFLMHVLEGMDRVSTAPALEIAKVGKDYRLGLGTGADYGA